ncbi:putative transporting ATPase [Vibrio ponticus]|nr:putative transporting ATPase [Vibrio ponticus]
MDFSLSAGFPFNVSCDNLNGDFEPDRLAFMAKVHAEVLSILEQGIPPRVKMLSEAMRSFYHVEPLTAEMFQIK